MLSIKISWKRSISSFATHLILLSCNLLTRLGLVDAHLFPNTSGVDSTYLRKAICGCPNQDYGLSASRVSANADIGQCHVAVPVDQVGKRRYWPMSNESCRYACRSIAPPNREA
jgi:hypothetical protein